MVPRTRGEDSGNGKHRGVLDPAVRRTGTAGLRMPAGEFALAAEGGWAEGRRGGRAVAADLTQLRAAERLVPSAGGSGSAADVAAPPGAIDRAPRAAHFAHPEGTVADEYPVEPGSDGRDGGDRAKDHPRHRGRGEERPAVGGLSRPKLQAQRRGDRKSVDGDMEGGACIRVETIVGIV